MTMLMSSTSTPLSIDQEGVSSVDQTLDRLVPSRSYRPDDPEVYRRIFSALDLD